MRSFQGMFHSNPDYAFWKGRSELRLDVTLIEDLASERREQKSRSSFFTICGVY